MTVSRATQFRLLAALTIGWAVWAGWSLLNQTTPYELLVMDDLGVPIMAANVDGDGSQLGSSGEDGRVNLEWRSETVLEVSAPGHITQMVTVADRPEETIDVVLRALVFRARVVDPEGKPVARARFTTSAGEGTSDAEGKVTVRGAEPGEVVVTRPAWTSATLTWEGGAGEEEVVIEPFVARAVHITGEAVRDDYDRYLQMATDTELNAVMIDLKDELGKVFYRTNNPVANEIGAAQNSWELASVVNRARARDLYVIARIVLFTDPIAAQKKPEMAVWDEATNAPFVSRGQYFLDPTDPDARKYGLDLAVEACEMGVNEVQFDYIRFPDDRPESVMFDGGVTPDVRLGTVNGFLTEAVELLHPLGCAVAADVFAAITRGRVEPDTERIGQNWEQIAAIVDVISPMIYPSHYQSGWYGFQSPNANPGPMVTAALKDGMTRLPPGSIVRPWLQDFGQSYGVTEVRAQIDAAEEFGFGWMLWNAVSRVTVDALGPPR